MDNAPAVLFRSSVVSRITLTALGATAVVAPAAILATGRFAAAPGYVVLFAAAVFIMDLLFLLNFYKLEVTFDGRAVTFGYGVLRKRVALTDIVTAQSVDINWWRFGGTGIRVRRGQRAWVTGSGPAIELVTTDGKTFYANCERPATLAALIESYRRAGNL